MSHYTYGGGTSGVRGGTSRVLHRVPSALVISTIFNKTHYSCYPIRIRCVKLSATRS